ncbi:MAG: DUF4836 family protein [Prevotella sp.]
MAVMVLLLSSCSDDAFHRVVPADSAAVVAIDVAQASGVGNRWLLSALLHAKNLDDSGVDLSGKAYLFETSDGDIGACLRVADSGKLENFISGLTAKGKAESMDRRSGFGFVVLNHEFLVGYTDDALLIIGPVAQNQCRNMQKRMVKWLKQGSDAHASSPIFARLDSLDGPMAMVAKVSALPDRVAAPLMLGAPRGTEPSEVGFSAVMNRKGKCLLMDGHTFGLKSQTDKAIKAAATGFRKLEGTFYNYMPKHSSMAFMVNVDGKQFLPMMQANKALQAMLAGANAAIDMDNIVRSVNGDLVVIGQGPSQDNGRFSMFATLEGIPWLSDVGYWKSSCPQGARIDDSGDNSWRYTSGNTAFTFSVSDDYRFYCGSALQAPWEEGDGKRYGLSENVTEWIEGHRMVLLADLYSLISNSTANPTMRSVLAMLFAKTDMLVCILD